MTQLNPTKEFTVNYSVDQVKKAILKLNETEPKYYQIDSISDALNQIRLHQTGSMLDAGYHVDFTINKLTDTETKVNIEITRAIGVINTASEMTIASNSMKTITNKFSAFLENKVDQYGKPILPKPTGCMLVLIALIILVSITLTTTAQMPMKDEKVFYEIIDSSITGTPQQLQAKAKMWLANTFRDSKEVIQVDDKDAGEVIGKGNVSWGSLPPHVGWFTIRISCKENKYRCQIYDMILKVGTEGDRRPVERWIARPSIGTKKNLGVFDKKMLAILDELKMSMAKADDNF